MEKRSLISISAVIQPYLLLLLLLLLGFIGKNQSIMVASSVLILIRLLGWQSWLFPPLEKNGINWGVTLLMIAVLVPIANGSVGLYDLIQSIKSPVGMASLTAGILVSVASISGVDLLRTAPEVTTAIVVGTLLAVILFKGIPVGPLIAAGVAALMLKGLDLAVHFFR